MSLKWYKSRLSPEIWEKGKLNLPLSKKINAQAIVAVITLIKIIYFKLIIYEKTPRKPRTEKWKNTQTFFVSQLRIFSEQLHISLISLTQATWSKGQETDRWGLTTHVSLYASHFKSSCEDDVSYGSQIRVSTTTLLPKWRILWQFRASRFCIPAGRQQRQQRGLTSWLQRGNISGTWGGAQESTSVLNKCSDLRSCWVKTNFITLWNYVSDRF